MPSTSLVPADNNLPDKQNAGNEIIDAEEKEVKPQPKIWWPAQVAKLKRADLAIINRGVNHGVTLGINVIFVSTGEEGIIDPETGKELESVVEVKCMGQVIQVQPTISIVQSTRKMGEEKSRYLKGTNPWELIFNQHLAKEIWDTANSKVILPADDRHPLEGVEIGDRVIPM